ncbi:MAG: RidA family protein, partial [Albidovulum sp.]
MSDIIRLETGTRMSKVVIHNGVVHVSGVVGEPGGDAAQQTRDCLAEIDRRLALAGIDKTRMLR